MFYSIRNLMDHHARELPEPWTLTNNAPYGSSKKEFMEWSKHPATEGHWVSMCEGISANVRVSMDNEVHQIYGIVCDYDSRCPADLAEYLRKCNYTEHKPSHCCRTQSGNYRVFWAFEKPFRVCGQEHFQYLMVHASKILKLEKFGAALDTGRLVQSATYYELGVDWVKVSDYVIPERSVCAWDYIAFMKTSKAKALTLAGVDVNIPMDVVAKAVEEKFPGRWTGPFEVGARGIRFWDSTADNPTGAILCETGVRYYTQGGGYKSWADIFGQTFVEGYVGDRAKVIVDRTYYDGREYWFETAAGKWEVESTERFLQSLKVLGFSAKTEKGETASEIDKLQVRIRREHAVALAGPVIHRPTGMLVHPDKQVPILNTRAIRALLPSAPLQNMNASWTSGKEHFPFIHRLLSCMFKPVQNHLLTPDEEENNWLPEYSPDIQLNTFLHWLKRSYTGALALRPCVGQVLIMVGKPSSGKTFIARHLIGSLLGGSAKGNKALLEGLQFNSDLAAAPVIRIDDPETKDHKGRQAFEERIKELVADGAMRSEAKYKEAADLPWCGRVVMTCNDDAYSVKMLPSLASSNADKIIILEVTSGARMKWSNEMSVNEKHVADELPKFARWLLDWTPPNDTLGEARYGVKPFHNPRMVDIIDDQGTVSIVLDVLDRAFRGHGPNQDGGFYFEGTSVDLYEMMKTAAPQAMVGITSAVISGVLNTLHRNGAKIMKSILNDNRRKVWRIPYDLTEMTDRAGKGKGLI